VLAEDRILTRGEFFWRQCLLSTKRLLRWCSEWATSLAKVKIASDVHQQVDPER